MRGIKKKKKTTIKETQKERNGQIAH